MSTTEPTVVLQMRGGPNDGATYTVPADVITRGEVMAARTSSPQHITGDPVPPELLDIGVVCRIYRTGRPDRYVAVWPKGA